MFDDIIDLINKYDSIVIFGHVSPDGDCFGSQVALKQSISIKYPDKKVYITGSGYRRFSKLLGKTDDVSEQTIKSSLAILVDGNDFSRMEDQRVGLAKAWIKFDHHIDNGLFVSGPAALNEDACSTCEIIHDFLTKKKFPIDDVVATALFLGIVTDTGRFQYITDFPKIFNIASDLSKKGAKVKQINYLLNLIDDVNLRFKAYVYENYVKTDGNLVYCVLKKSVLKKFGFSVSKANSMINIIGNLNGYPIWAFFSEDNEGNHVEFRSNKYDVQTLCAKYGGGGHKLAAGFTLTKFNKQIINQIIKEANEIKE